MGQSSVEQEKTALAQLKAELQKVRNCLLPLSPSSRRKESRLSTLPRRL